MFSNVAQVLTCFSIISYSTTRHFDYLILTVLTETLVFRTVTPMSSKRMAIVSPPESVIVIATPCSGIWALLVYARTCM